jgi:hypothetical protein
VAADYSPKGIGRLVDQAISLYRANFRTIALPAVYFLMPLALAMSVAQSQLTALMVRSIESQAGADAGPASLPMLFAVTGVAYGGLSLLVAVVAVGLMYYLSCLLHATTRLLAHEPIGPAEFLKGGWPRFGYLVLAAFMLSIVTGLGYLFLIVPGIVVAVYGALAVPMTVLEESSIGDVFVRSFSLVSGNFWRVVGFFVASGVIVYTLQSAFTSLAAVPVLLNALAGAKATPVPSLPWQVFTGVMQGAAYAVAAPLEGLCLVALYLDLRSRREGMDLLVRAQRLAARPA